MKDNNSLRQLKMEYKLKIKQASSKEEKAKIKQAYKETKQTLKGVNRLSNEESKFNRESDKFWSNFEFPKIDNPEETLNEAADKDSSTNASSLDIDSKKVLDEMNKTINVIDQKIAERENEIQSDRSDYFTYKKGDIEFGRSQCDFCIFNDKDNPNKCTKYPNAKPIDVVKTEKLCECFEIKPLDNK